MGASVWKRVEGRYYRIAAVPAEKRIALLKEACHGDPDLRREVEALQAREIWSVPGSGGPEKLIPELEGFNRISPGWGITGHGIFFMSYEDSTQQTVGPCRERLHDDRALPLSDAG
jgi:hypothetical protein